MLIGSRSKLCNLIIQQALLVKYRINTNIDNLDYIQYRPKIPFQVNTS